MAPRHNSVPSYMQCYAAQLGSIGRAGQRRLQRASVLVVGAGGLGTAISITLATAGVGKLVVVDPQEFTPDNFNRSPSGRARDIGRPKVDVLAAFLDGRPHLTVVPVLGRAEALESFRDAQDLDLVVAASNTPSSRLATARFACRRALPHVSAALTDSRGGFGGFVATWVPERRSLACPACFLTPNAHLARGESLLAPVVSVVGAIAAWMTISLLARPRRQHVLDCGNCMALDLENQTLESLSVLRRADCSACSPTRRGLASRKRR